MSTGTKPTSTRPVHFVTLDGRSHHGFYLRDANRYVRGVNRWKDTDLNAWFDDDVVTAWGYEAEQIAGQVSLFSEDAVNEAVAEDMERE